MTVYCGDGAAWTRRSRRGCPRPWPGRTPPPPKAHHPEAAAAAAAAGSVARGTARSWLGGQTAGRPEAAGSPYSRSPSDPRGHTLLRSAPAGSGNPAQEEEEGEAGEGQPRVRRPLEHSGPPKLPSVPGLRPGPSPQPPVPSPQPGGGLRGSELPEADPAPPAPRALLVLHESSLSSPRATCGPSEVARGRPERIWAHSRRPANVGSLLEVKSGPGSRARLAPAARSEG